MHDLGFINKSLHEKRDISINSQVSGKIVVAGYPKCAKKYLDQLKEKYGDIIDVQRIDLLIK
jgi:hypothetical protein